MIQILSLNVERQGLIIVIVLAAFLKLEVDKNPYIHHEMNSLAHFSMAILLLSFVLKLFSYSISDNVLDGLVSILIIVVNSCFFAVVLWRFVKVNREAFMKLKRILQKSIRIKGTFVFYFYFFIE